jgi:hypothetical protein
LKLRNCHKSAEISDGSNANNIGSKITEFLPQFAEICGFAIVFNGWAVLSYSKNN